MKHPERIRLARILAKEIGRKYGDDILVIALSGSTARSEDLRFSDLELLSVTARKIPDRVFAYHGIIIELLFITKDEAERTLKDPSSGWWFGWAGLFQGARPIQGDKRVLSGLQRMVISIPEDMFRAAAEMKLLWTMEHMNHVRNACSDRDEASAMAYGLYFRNSVAEFVALTNGKYYKSHPFKSLQQASSFKLLPNDYDRLMKRLGTSSDVDVIRKSVEELWKSTSLLAKAHGIKLRQFSSVGKSVLG